MDIFISVMMFVMGLCVGSFVNMLVYRTAVNYRLLRRKTPRNDVGGRSFCDHCGKQLSWYDNVPVVSWLLLGGRTRCCRKMLDKSYPLVELGTGMFFLIYDLRFMIYESNTIFWILGLVMITLLMFSAIFDAKYMILPDFSTIILIIIAFVGVVFDEKNIIPYLVSAAGASGFLLFLHLITRGKGMGMGDVKLAVFMGMLLGWPKIIIAFYVAFIVGAVVGASLMILKKVGKKSLIPFGPFLIGGTVVAWWWGEKIIQFIISNF